MIDWPLTPPTQLTLIISLLAAISPALFTGFISPFPRSNWLRGCYSLKLGQGLLLDLVLAVIGAVVSGYLVTAIGATGLIGFNLYCMFVAIIGAVVVLWFSLPRQFGFSGDCRRLSWRTSRD